uniref:NADH-ubiquinone oxidoreductase chain 6 n=1 Tax=Somatochlora hineana TaxID=2070507 RepID=A0A343S9X3_9ODON|nr:NADH dehydrogenase subunit 6 [Somatochlora hineana]
MTMLIINSFLFSSMNHPMNMGITLLMQTVMMCVLTGLMSQTSWFSYILFLVFLGGMLVLFIYMTSIASNELFMKSNYYFLIFSLIIMSVMLLLMLDPFIMNNNSEDTLPNMMMANHKNVLIPLYNNPTSYITVFMVLYLFLTLLVIVMITKYNKGPLRPMN